MVPETHKLPLEMTAGGGQRLGSAVPWLPGRGGKIKGMFHLTSFFADSGLSGKLSVRRQCKTLFLLAQFFLIIVLARGLT